MLPGPTIIKECSACGKHIAEETFASHNNLGARYWTDGKQEGPMMPDSLWLVKCAHCSALLWIDEQKRAGERWPEVDYEPGTVALFADARRSIEPTVEDYTGYLAAQSHDVKKQKYLRLRLWWLGNDARRHSNHPAPLTEDEKANLHAYLRLLDDAKPPESIMKAEMLRELGLFADSETLLAGPQDPSWVKFVSVINELNSRKYSAVSQVRFN